MNEEPHTIDRDVVYFGRVNFRGKNRLFGIRRQDRRQHTYVVGKTGTGKTTLLHNMMVQDIANGEGVCVVDPHGEFAESLLQKIPEERIKDVVYFNPADPDASIGFNVLELPDPRYKHLVASGLMSIFTKIWSNVWSARMEYILNNAILALLDTPNSTLLGITRILVDKEFRQKIVSNVKDPVVRSFWINEYEEWRDQFRNEAIAPIQNKVGQFLSTALIRNIVGQAKSTIDIFDIMNSGKILLVNVSKGRIGEDNSALLGAMIITKLQLAAMERVRVPEDERVDFFLYVDEFQNFATDSFANILSEARKYRLNLTLAHQYIGQLVTDVSTKVRDAVFGNVGTMIIFRVGAADAEFLEKELEPEFAVQDMVNLPNREIYLKLMVNGVTCRPFSASTLPPFRVPSSQERAEFVAAESKKRYARPRWVIEGEINEWAGALSTGSGDFEAVCSSCGTLTRVPFEPEEGRPVYCQNCLSKIKSGEMAPVRFQRGVPRTLHRAPARENYEQLASLGIEFEEAGTPTPVTPQQEASVIKPPQDKAQSGTIFEKWKGKQQERRDLPQREERTPRKLSSGPMRPAGGRPPSILNRPTFRANVTPDATAEVAEAREHELRLAELTPDEKSKTKHGSNEPVNIDGLKDALREALTKLQK